MLECISSIGTCWVGFDLKSSGALHCVSVFKLLTIIFLAGQKPD